MSQVEPRKYPTTTASQLTDCVYVCVCIGGVVMKHTKTAGSGA